MYVIFKSGWIINHTFHLKKKNSESCFIGAEISVFSWVNKNQFENKSTFLNIILDPLTTFQKLELKTPAFQYGIWNELSHMHTNKARLFTRH